MSREIKGQQYVKEIPKIYRKLADKPYTNGYRTTSIVKKPYGFIITRFSHYISIQKIRFEILSDGFSKATVKVDTNYKSNYQFTLYFDKGLELVEDNNDPLNVTKCRKVWQKLRNNYT